MLIKYLRRYPLSLFISVVVVILSLFPFGRIELVEGVPLADKWTHMVMYAGLTSVIWFEYWHSHSCFLWSRLIPWAVVAPIAMSGTLELLQAYATTYRSGEWLDLLANSIGVAIGAVIGVLMRKVLR